MLTSYFIAQKPRISLNETLTERLPNLNKPVLFVRDASHQRKISVLGHALIFRICRQQLGRDPKDGHFEQVSGLGIFPGQENPVIRDVEAARSECQLVHAQMLVSVNERENRQLIDSDNL